MHVDKREVGAECADAAGNGEGIAVRADRRNRRNGERADIRAGADRGAAINPGIGAAAHIDPRERRAGGDRAGSELPCKLADRAVRVGRDRDRARAQDVAEPCLDDARIVEHRDRGADPDEPAGAVEHGEADVLVERGIDVDAAARAERAVGERRNVVRHRKDRDRSAGAD